MGKYVRSYKFFSFLLKVTWMFFLQQAAAEIVRNFEDFFDNVLWRTVVNPQSGEFENFFTANPL